jgi:hypothetical protein
MNTMNKFSTQKPWALGLVASLIVTYGSFSAIASTFQHVAADASTNAFCKVELPAVTVTGKHAAVAIGKPAVKL